MTEDGTMTDFEGLREKMVERQIAARGISDPAILDAFRAVPRERFVPGHLQSSAYADGALPIACSQTISQPYIVALMIHSARVGPESRVLEVGAGSGYAAALLGRLAGEVIAIERIPELAEAARERLQALGIANVAIVTADGTRGWPGRAPYDAILVAATAAEPPRALLDQLTDGGRLVIPLGSPALGETLVRITRHGERFEEEPLTGVRFVPLIAG
jgi:protein-L-isoaspartate(D-aspartate) O-methyltransferase